MNQLLQIEEACGSNNHEIVKSLLDSFDSDDLRREAYLKIIEYYDNKSLFPIGYVLHFVKWLILNNDYKTAMDHILKSRQMGVSDERLSDLIYECLIKPKEKQYREHFNRNIQLHKKYGVLVSDCNFNFDDLKKKIVMIANIQEVPDSQLKFFEEGRIPLFVDVTDIAFINKVINITDFAYCIYEDVQKFYYLNLFEDYSEIYKYMEAKKTVLFVGNEKKILEDFYAHFTSLLPEFCFGLSITEKYSEIINGIKAARQNTAHTIIKELNEFYGSYDETYYTNLFKREPSEIKIMLVTSEHTELNKFIVYNWNEALLAMGYRTKLIIEQKPYERMSNYYIYYAINEYRPDIVFNINFTVNDVFGSAGSEICKNLLWITRYRDILGSDLYHAVPGYKYHNMFTLPFTFEWGEKLQKAGVPENRILTTYEGVNTSVFSPRREINRKYACDIVCVNHSVGSLKFRLDILLQEITNEGLIKAIYDLIEELKETIDDESVIFSIPDYKKIIEMLNEKLFDYGQSLKGGTDKANYIGIIFEHVMDTLCRSRIIEWVVDSGITSNIKFWGKGWSNIDKFKKFHMGIAEHGEELSAIYRNGKISISDSQWPLHERNFEIQASGGFPLIRHIERVGNNALNEITGYFKENEEVVLFYTKDDLLNKIQYYLDNPEERAVIAENGRQVVLNNFSHIAVARKTMNFIKNYYAYSGNVDAIK